MLIKTKEELKTYISTLHKNTSHETLLSFVEQAEAKYVAPYVGYEMMDELQQAYDAVALSPVQKTLMKYLGKSIAFYALLDTLPNIIVSIGDAGVMENQPNGSAPVRQWAYHQLENSTATNADVFLDLALNHLDRNVSDFPTWRNSEAFLDSKRLYLNTNAELTRLTNIQGSRRAFIAMQPYILRAEEFYIRPVLGDELDMQLKASMLESSDQTETQRELLRLVRRVLAQAALYEAMPEICFTHTGSGLKVLNENDGIRQRLSISQDERVTMSSLAKSRANIYMEELKRYLDTLLQAGETDPAENGQAFVPYENTQSPSFWIG